MNCIIILVLVGSAVALLSFAVERRRSGISGLYEDMARQQQIQRGELLRANSRKDALTFAAYGALSLGVLAMSVTGIFVVWREVLLLTLDAQMSGSPWWDFTYILIHLFLGFAIFIMAMVAEHALRHSIKQQRLLATFARFALVICGIGVIGVVVRNYVFAGAFILQ